MCLQTFKCELQHPNWIVNSLNRSCHITILSLEIKSQILIYTVSQIHKLNLH